MKFTRNQVKEIRDEMQIALDKIAEKYNSGVTVGRITFGETISTKIRFDQMTSNKHGKFALTKEAQNLIDRSARLGMREDIVNEKFIYQGDEIVIMGLSTRSPKYPIKYTQNGKNFKCGIDYMKKMVKEVHPEWFL